jgi:hypothetical protein
MQRARLFAFEWIDPARVHFERDGVLKDGNTAADGSSGIALVDR